MKEKMKENMNEKTEGKDHVGRIKMKNAGSKNQRVGNWVRNVSNKAH